MGFFEIAQETSANVKKLIDMKTNIPCLVLSKLLLVALPIAQIWIGAKYLKDCPQQNYIPVYLLVYGVFFIALSLAGCLPCCKKDNSGLKKFYEILTRLGYTFIFCWFIAGSVWIYSIYPPNYNATVVDEPYCNETLYKFAFWTTTLCYILLAIAFVVFCCLFIWFQALCSKFQSEEVPQE